MATKARTAFLFTAIVATTTAGYAQNEPSAKARMITKKFGETNPNFGKMSPRVLAVREAQKNKMAVPSSVASLASKAKRGDKYQIVIASADNEAVVKAAAAAGLDVVETFDRFGCRSVTVRTADLAALDALIDVPAVKQIRFEHAAQRRSGTVAGQGDLCVKADVARTFHSIDGTGARVGILSDTFNRAETPKGTVAGGFLTGNISQNSGDLPASVRIVAIGPTSGSDEGRGMAEIVHDIAPGAEISWASAFDSYTSFANNITALATDGATACNVICDDVAYFEEPVYQDGPIALAYEDAYINHGVACFSSAGNSAFDAHHEAFSRATADPLDFEDPPTGKNLYNWGGGKTHLRISIPSGSEVIVTLHWNQPYGGSELGAGPGAEGDLDLLLVSNTTVPVTSGAILAASQEIQGSEGSPSGDPVEILSFENTGASARTAYVIVNHYQGAAPGFVHVQVDGATIVDRSFLNDNTVWGHPAAKNVMATSAIFWAEAETGQFDGSTSTIDPEPFTSFGGALKFYFNENGSANPLVEIRNKPDLTAPDGMNTLTFGQDTVFGSANVYKGEDDARPNFFGTSAAAPAAAAVAALLIHKRADATAPHIYHALKSTAFDLNTTAATGGSDGTGPGYDFRTGFGLINALDAASAMELEPPPSDTFIIE